MAVATNIDCCFTILPREARNSGKREDWLVFRRRLSTFDEGKREAQRVNRSRPPSECCSGLLVCLFIYACKMQQSFPLWSKHRHACVPLGPPTPPIGRVCVFFDCFLKCGQLVISVSPGIIVTVLRL